MPRPVKNFLTPQWMKEFEEMCREAQANKRTSKRASEQADKPASEQAKTTSGSRANKK